MSAIREATNRDVEAIACLHAEGWRDTYHPALTAAYLASEVVADRRQVWSQRAAAPSPNQRVLLACDGEEVTGFACTFVAADPRWGSLLDNLHVKRDRRGEGIGTLLLRAAAQNCADEAPDAGLYLWVLRVNVSAQAFYRRHGASPQDDDVWHAPDGSRVPVQRYAWAPGDLPCRSPRPTGPST